MTDEQSSGNVNISDISGGETNVGNIVTGQVGGDVVGGDKVARDKVAGDKYETHVHPALSSEERRDLRNRQAMLSLVHNTWIEGVLEKSLHGAVMLELGLEEKTGEVQRPWDTVLKIPGEADALIPHDRKLLEIFDQSEQALLILGAPGSGKTTMLLDLTRELIARAGDDEERPIPVVFNLSSWGEKKQTLEDWLVAELRRMYHLSGKVARPWVEQGDLCLLLDGLDEVAADRREACVQAINAYRQAGNFVQLAICSRTADYNELRTKLKLQRAVAIQPLSTTQIEAYLDGAGVALQEARRTLTSDPALREVVESPLMLSIVTLAYKGRALDLHALSTAEARRTHIFETYIEAALRRRGEANDRHNFRERATDWLA